MTGGAVKNPPLHVVFVYGRGNDCYPTPKIDSLTGAHIYLGVCIFPLTAVDMLLRCLSIRERSYCRRVFNISALTTLREAFKTQKITHTHTHMHKHSD